MKRPIDIIKFQEQMALKRAKNPKSLQDQNMKINVKNLYSQTTPQTKRGIRIKKWDQK